MEYNYLRMEASMKGSGIEIKWMEGGKLPMLMIKLLKGNGRKGKWLRLIRNIKNSFKCLVKKLRKID